MPRFPHTGLDLLWVLAGLTLTVLAVSMEHFLAAGLFGFSSVVLLMIPWVTRRVFEVRAGAAPEIVEFDDQTIRRTMPDGKVESIDWHELHEVSIVTTGEGPFVEDVFWLLSNEDQSKGCAIAGGAEGFGDFLGRLQDLPGFDNEAVIHAMGSTDDNRFLAWRRPPENAQP